MSNTIYSKSFSKADFFKAIAALADKASNDENYVDAFDLDSILACAEYELDKLAAEKAKAAEKRGTASTDRMACTYAAELAKAILSVLTATPQTADEIATKLEGKSINGKAITLSPWMYSVCNALSGNGKSGASLTEEGRKNINPNGVIVKATMKKVSTKNSKGLIVEKLASAYAIG